uniref:Putative secreted protein n=1 Tax=Anopheles darlingi TaxID=43151 RepID=A0A2M4D5G6_ANODA
MSCMRPPADFCVCASVCVCVCSRQTTTHAGQQTGECTNSARSVRENVPQSGYSDCELCGLLALALARLPTTATATTTAAVLTLMADDHSLAVSLSFIARRQPHGAYMQPPPAPGVENNAINVGARREHYCSSCAWCHGTNWGFQ